MSFSPYETSVVVVVKVKKRQTRYLKGYLTLPETYKQKCDVQWRSQPDDLVTMQNFQRNEYLKNLINFQSISKEMNNDYNLKFT